MKRLVLILLIACVAFVGCEKAAEAKGNPCDSKILGPILNECYPHHEKIVDTDTVIKRKGSTYGVGADLVLWQNDTEKVTFIEEVIAEYKYDLRYEDHSAYAVVRLNLWDKIKSLFSRDE